MVCSTPENKHCKHVFLLSKEHVEGPKFIVCVGQKCDTKGRSFHRKSSLITLLNYTFKRPCNEALYQTDGTYLFSLHPVLKSCNVLDLLVQLSNSTNSLKSKSVIHQST